MPCRPTYELTLEPNIGASLTRDVIPEMVYISACTGHKVHCDCNGEHYTVHPKDCLADVERRYPDLKDLREAIEKEANQ